MKTLKILIIVILSSTATLTWAQTSIENCQQEILEASLKRIERKIINTPSLSEIKSKMSGDVRSVLEMKTASVVDMRKSNFKGQAMGYVQVMTKPKIAWVSFSVSFAMNETCNSVQFEKSVFAEAIPYEDGSLTGF